MKLYTIVRDYQHEIIIEKSRFICTLKKVSTEEEAQDFIKETRKKYWDATHNCSAYIVGENTAAQRSNDDGEPSGTAGLPMLEVLRKNNLHNVAAVVTRYFGGIKLGAGGLIRAYGHAAVLGLNEASILEMTPFQEVAITISYELLASVEHWIRQKEIRSTEPDYADQVTLHLLLPPSEQEQLLRELTDLTSARFHQENGNLNRIALPIR